MSDAWIPTEARVHLAHAAVQAIARAGAVDLLHVKGPAVADGLRTPLGSTDADILVRPAHVAALERALRAHGWVRQTTFAQGSAWHHAATWWHAAYGYLDVHRRWPGVGRDPEAAFESWWRDRQEFLIAHRPCPVPSRDVQLVLLVLHEARSGPGRLATEELRSAWRRLADADRQRVARRVGDLDAANAFAMGLGQPVPDPDHREYLLWRVYSEGGGRIEEWRARWHAARGVAGKALVLADAARVSRGFQRMQLGREPTARDMVGAHAGRVRVVAREVMRRVGGARARSRREDPERRA